MATPNQNVSGVLNDYNKQGVDSPPQKPIVHCCSIKLRRSIHEQKQQSPRLNSTIKVENYCTGACELLASRYKTNRVCARLPPLPAPPAPASCWEISLTRLLKIAEHEEVDLFAADGISTFLPRLHGRTSTRLSLSPTRDRLSAVCPWRQKRRRHRGVVTWYRMKTIGSMSPLRLGFWFLPYSALLRLLVNTPTRIR